MTNFSFFTPIPAFSSFAPIAASAEQILPIDREAAVLNCRRAMEFAVKWMYSVDGSLTMPYDDSLVSLMNDPDFRDIVGTDVWRRMDFIRRLGNQAAHGGKPVTKEQAALCLENLFIFFDLVAYFYADTYEEHTFDPSLLRFEPESAAPAAPPVPPAPVVPEVNLQALMDENKALKAELTARREQQQPSYVPKPLDLSEYETRKLYIDTMLTDAGWKEGKDWQNEVEVTGMPSPSGIGYADYVLWGDDGRPLAVVEAKSTCVGVEKGRQQAKLYADSLERKYHRRPVVFLTNGFETRIIDNVYPERRCANIWSKRDLERVLNLRTMRTSLKYVTVDPNIAGRYYQEAAVKAVCKAFEGNRRKALLVMATGSGKTRTVMALCDVLLNHGWVRNVLFLADRTSLVTQAKRAFVNLMPDLSVTNLCEEKDNYTAHCVFSTYQTMYNVIDAVNDEQNGGRLFTTGHFDLIICDEAHRSIYNKYRDIFTYFDAPLVGLTATPKDEIDKNTYEIFELQNGVPTYGYELAQAVRDGYLVDFVSVETKLKFIEKGIFYDNLSEADKRKLDDTFVGGNGGFTATQELNEWMFNKDTIRIMLDTLMKQGLKIDYGSRLGKTIIFATSHEHAELILKVFNEEYPHLPGFASVIDNYSTYAQSAIDEFSDPKKLPQIAISVDMLDTGIDVPEVLNLVFFKKVMSKAKFWQMIGRGTRLCPGLIDGNDKEKFYIFDFCGNFEFFRMNQGKPAPIQTTLQGALFVLKASIVFALQDEQYRTPELMTMRESLVADMVRKVKELNKENFAVRQHLKFVEKYTEPENYVTLTYEDTLKMGTELAPLLLPDEDDAKALRFDALLYRMELACLAKKQDCRAKADLLNKVKAVSAVNNIPEIAAQSELLGRILHTDMLDHAGIDDLEMIRVQLRYLMRYIPHGKEKYETNFDDEILSVDRKESELENDDLKNYKAKVEFYIRQHTQDNPVIAKLRGNQPLTSDDIKELESILWNDLGTRTDYESEYGEKPLGEFVRELVGMDMTAAKAAFAEYLNDSSLDDRQIYFVNQIVEYIVHNGMMKDLSVLQEAPFSDYGSIVEVFTDLSVWAGIRKTIEQVNMNARAA